MNRKNFIKKGALGLGTIISIPTVFTSCEKDPPIVDPPNSSCTTSPKESAGPFKIKTPAELINENIIGDRTGVGLLINLTILNSNNNCEPLSNVYVDIWHCDPQGNYSEYDNQPGGDFTDKKFLRGRQLSDDEGKVSFLSLYPGWYPGRATHIHLEVLTSDNSSILVSEIALPEDISGLVYAEQEYNGNADTSNSNDTKFGDSLALNLPDSILGTKTTGYTLEKMFRVPG